MNLESPQRPGPEREELPWHVYDRHADLFHVASSLSEAEAWAAAHWGVVEVAHREEIDSYDYWYLVLTSPGEAPHQARDYQVRIIRQDRVSAIGWDANASQQFP